MAPAVTIVAQLDAALSDEAIRGRADFRVAQIEIGLGELSLGLRHLRIAFRHGRGGLTDLLGHQARHLHLSLRAFQIGGRTQLLAGGGIDVLLGRGALVDFVLPCVLALGLLERGGGGLLLRLARS